MKTIGVRELRQRASEYLRLVREGETLQVTDRGFGGSGLPSSSTSPCWSRTTRA